MLLSVVVDLGGSGSANTNSGGGGGGAGTYRTGSVAITSGTYNVTIGAGGGKNNGSNSGSQGGTTTLALPSSVLPGGGIWISWTYTWI